MAVVDVRAGRLRDVVRFERKDETLDAWGQESNVWTELFTARGNIDDRSVGEGEGADQTRGIQRAQITMRYVEGIRAKDRVVDTIRGDVWEVVGVHDVMGMRSRIVVTVERKKV